MPYVTTGGLYLPPFGSSGQDEWDKMYGGFESVEERLVSQYTPEIYGAIGNGTADDTAAVQAAINAYGSNYGFVQLKNRYLVTSEITLPRNVFLLGSPGATLIGDQSGKVVNVTGLLTDPVGTSWVGRHLIQGIIFDGIGIEYGRNSATDNGQGTQLSQCIFRHNPNIAVRYLYNGWNTLIDGCQFILNDEATGGDGIAIQVDQVFGIPSSGSCMRIVNSLICHGQYGLYLNNDNEGGCHFMITNTDFEHLDVGIYAKNFIRSSGGVVNLTDCHFELNNIAHIINEGAYIYIKGGWYYPTVADTFIANFVTGYTSVVDEHNGRLVLSNSRVAWLDISCR